MAHIRLKRNKLSIYKKIIKIVNDNKPTNYFTSNHFTFWGYYFQSSSIDWQNCIITTSTSTVSNKSNLIALYTGQNTSGGVSTDNSFLPNGEYDVEYDIDLLSVSGTASNKTMWAFNNILGLTIQNYKGIGQVNKTSNSYIAIFGINSNNGSRGFSIKINKLIFKLKK